MTTKDYFTIGIALFGMVWGVLAFIYAFGRKEQSFVADIAVIKDKVVTIEDRSVVRLNLRVDDLHKNIEGKLSLKDFKEFKTENSLKQKEMTDGLTFLSKEIGKLCADMASIKKELEIYNSEKRGQNGKHGQNA